MKEMLTEDLTSTPVAVDDYIKEETNREQTNSFALSSKWLKQKTKDEPLRVTSSLIDSMTKVDKY